MSCVNITIDSKYLKGTKKKKLVFYGGDTIPVLISWFDKYPLERLCLSLLREVRGKGSTTTELAHTVDIDTALTSGEQVIDLTLPYGPPSYGGRLISIAWSIQVMLTDSGAYGTKDFTLCSAGEKPPE